MAEKHDPNQLVGAAPDIAPLAWVMDEIRHSLNEAVNGLKAFVASKQDVDSLRGARNQIHQANGALQLLDLRGVALVTEAVEQLTRRFEADPKECSPDPVRTIETALSAVVAYLEGLLSGRPNQPIRLFPYYRDVLQLNQAARVHPADLVFPDLSRRPAFHQIEARNFTPRQLRDRRARFELGLLGFLRNSDDAAPRKRMRDALADLEHMPQRGLARSFWWIARGLLEALEAGAVAVDVDLKRVLARLNLQLRRMIEGGGAVAERLMVDALYYVGRAQGTLPRVIEVKRLYGLDALIPEDFERASLTALDADALRALKEALVQAKQLWGQIVAGSGDTTKFEHEIGLARETSRKLQARPLVAMIEAIGRVSKEFSGLPPNVREAVGLEIASALLFVDLGVDELPQIESEYEGRALLVMDRLAKARNGRAVAASGAVDVGAGASRAGPLDDGHRGRGNAGHAARNRAATRSLFPQSAGAHRSAQHDRDVRSGVRRAFAARIRRAGRSAAQCSNIDRALFRCDRGTGARRVWSHCAESRRHRLLCRKRRAGRRSSARHVPL